MVAHGANPGLVSHFVKQALLNLAADTGVETAVPANRTGWGALAKSLGVKVIHIAERDTQVANIAKQRGEFVNTWSIDGFVGEGCQPAELGWGTHEKALPAGWRCTMNSAAMPRSTSTAPAPPPACAPGRRWKARSMAFSSPITRPSRSPIISR